MSPGGVRDFSDFSELPEELGPYEISSHHLKFNFLPTYSTLDIGSGSLVIDNEEIFASYSRANPPTGSSESSFDNWVTHADDNSNHLNFSVAFGQFLIAELEGSSSTACFSECGLDDFEYSVDGPEVMCVMKRVSST